MAILPSVKYPLDRWFKCQYVGPVKISRVDSLALKHTSTLKNPVPETFYYNPSRYSAKIFRKDEEICIDFRTQVSSELAGKYQPTPEELAEIMPPQILETLCEILGSGVMPSKRPEPSWALFATYALFLWRDWKTCLQGTELEPVIKKVEVEFFNHVTTLAVYKYTHGAEGKDEELSQLKDLLTELGFNDVVNKINAALRKQSKKK